jgi:hypothetical protein
MEYLIVKPKDVSVSVSDFGDGEFVTVTFRLPNHSLEREAACPNPPNCDATKFGKRVKESARKAKAKLLRKIIEEVEFPDA